MHCQLNGIQIEYFHGNHVPWTLGLTGKHAIFSQGITAFIVEFLLKQVYCRSDGITTVNDDYIVLLVNMIYKGQTIFI